MSRDRKSVLIEQYIAYHEIIESTNFCPLGKKRKTSTFFHSGGHKTNLNALFWMFTLGQICCYFAFVLVSISLIQGRRVKGTLSIKILVLCLPELEFCVLRKAKKILKPKTLDDLQVLGSNYLNVYSNDIVYLL